MTAQQPITTQTPGAPTPQQAAPVIGGYPAPGAPAADAPAEQVYHPPSDPPAGDPPPVPSLLANTRYSLPLTPRGAIFASNSLDNGVTVNVTRGEARVLYATGMIGASAPAGGPALASMNPSKGPDGTAIIISGIGFGTQGANSKVTIGGVVATAVAWTPFEVRVYAVKGASAVDTPLAVVLTTQAGPTLACGNFTFEAAFTVGAVTPATGPNGQSFTIAGTGLQNNSGYARVRVGVIDATVTAWTTTLITCTAVRGAQPIGAPFVVTVTRADSAQKTAANGFTFTS